jgi:hypothetical protein
VYFDYELIKWFSTFNLVEHQRCVYVITELGLIPLATMLPKTGSEAGATNSNANDSMSTVLTLLARFEKEIDPGLV